MSAHSPDRRQQLREAIARVRIIALFAMLAMALRPDAVQGQGFSANYWARIYPGDVSMKVDVDGSGNIFASGRFNHYLYRLDASGNVIFARQLSQGRYYNDLLVDGGYVYIASGYDYIHRITANGDVGWSRRLDTGTDVRPHYIIRASDGNYIVASDIDISHLSLIKYSPAGNLIWQRLIRNVTCYSYNRNIFVIGSRIFVLRGENIICLDSSGNYLWAKNFDVMNLSLTGMTSTDVGDEYIVSGASTSGFFLMRMDIDANNNGSPAEGDVAVLWSTTYSEPNLDADVALVQQVSGTEYIVGASGDLNYPTNASIITMRVDGNGNILWQNNWGHGAPQTYYINNMVIRNNKIYYSASIWGPLETAIIVLDDTGTMADCPYVLAPSLGGAVQALTVSNASYTVEITTYSLDAVTGTITDLVYSVETVCECGNPNVASSPTPAPNGSACNPVTVSWTGDPAATSFDVTLDGAAVPACTGIGVTSCALGALSSGAHSWSVLTHGICGQTQGAAWALQAHSAAPAAAAYLTPANGATVCNPVTFSWNAAADATAYDLVVDGVVVAPDLIGTVGPPATLSQGAHTWQVIAKNGCGSTPGPVWTLTANALPGPVSAPAPTLGAWVCNPATLSWAPSVSSLPVVYDVVLDGAPLCSNIPGTTCALGALPNGAHTWTVIAKTACGSTPGADWTFRSFSAAPGVVGNPVPPNLGATCSPVMLLWTADPEATAYDVFVDGGLICADTTLTNCNPGALALGLHTWQVISKNPCGNTAGALWSFTVASNVPTGAASSPSPANGALICNPVTLSWTAGAGASYYDLLIDGVLAASDLAATSYAVGDMTGGFHSWYLIAKNGCGPSTTGPSWSFTVNPAHMPAVPVPVSPKAHDYACPPLTLTWEPAANAETYDVFIDFDLMCADVQSPRCPVGDLPEGQYAWWVVAKNGCASVTSMPVPFTVSFDPPGPVAGPSPADGANVIAPVILSWAATPGALTYDLLLDGDFIAGALAQPSYAVPALSPGMHTWMVIARSSCGTSTGPVWSFNNVLYATEWIRSYGGPSSEAGTAAATDEAGRTLLAGWTTSFGASGKDAWALATDATGAILWQRTFGSGGDDALYAAASAGGGRWILAGGTRSFGRVGWDVWLLLVGEAGNILWQTAAGGDGDEIARGVLATADGGFVTVGETDSFGAGGRDFWAAKFSASGDLLWQRASGGSGDDFCTGILPEQHGFLVYGYTYSPPARGSDACVFFLDGSGNLFAGYTYGTAGMDAFHAGVALDGGFIMAGNTDAPGGGQKDAFVAALDGDGGLLWHETLGGPSIEQAFALSASADGGFVLGGSSRSFSAGSYDFWLARFGAARAIEWQKIITGTGDEKIYGLSQTADQGFLAVGETASYGSGGSDLWAVKISDEGAIRGCALALPTDASPGAVDLSFEPRAFENQATSAGYAATEGQTRLPEAENIAQCECARVAGLPEPSAPSNGAVTPSLTVELGWAPAVNADSYIVHLGTSLEAMEEIATTGGTHWTVSGLQAGTVYFWRVTAVSSCNEASAAPWWFETPGASPLGDHVYFLPVVSRMDGAQGSHWVTDGSFQNGSDQAVAYTLTYVPGGWGGARSAMTHRSVIDARQMAVHPDLLYAAFGVENGSGWLKVEANGPLTLGARVYHRAADGTYGQYVPGFDLESGTALLHSGDKGHLIQLSNGDRYRANLGFTEPTGLGATAVIALYDAAGTYLAGTRQSVPAGGQVQINNVFAALGLGAVEAARAEVTMEGAGALLAYASVVDNGTNDAIFIPAQRGESGSGSAMIPVVTHLRGALDTTWRSDVRLFNTSGGSRDVHLTYRWGSGEETVTRSLPTGRLDDLRDIVASLFGESGESSGSLLLEHDGGVMASSRTYNLEEKGTYGQYVPSITPGEAMKAGPVRTIPLLSSTAAFRSNAGFTEMTGAPATVEGSLFNASGELLGRATWEVPAWGHIQENIFTAMQVKKEIYFAYLQVRVVDGTGALACYASVVDNITGDAIYIPAQ